MKSFAALITFAAMASTAVVGVAASPPVPAYRVKMERRQQGQYPPGYATAPPAMLPQDWRDALTAATAAGKIPGIPPSTPVPGVGTTYPDPKMNTDPNVCSWTTTKCNGPRDLVKAPDNTWIVSFDDGPTNASPDLYGFLQQQNQSATHFMIGSQILTYQAIFKQAVGEQQQLAVHTWSHQMMTTLTTEEVLGELGWTMQIIYDLSGRVPTMWRPPQGDIDNRVRAVAEEIFGLQAVMWDAECNDWCLTEAGGTACPQTVPGNTLQSVVSAVDAAIARPKSPGVILLEHELTSVSVGIFKTAYPQIKSSGWQTKAVGDALGQDWYTNAKSNLDTPRNVTGMTVDKNKGTPSPSSTTSTSSTGAASSTKAGMTSSTSSSANATKTAGNQLHTSGAMPTGVTSSFSAFACLLAVSVATLLTTKTTGL